MSEADPIKQALSQVDAGEVDPGGPDLEMDEEPTARPEGPAPDHGADVLEEEPEESGFNLLSWAERVPDGSHLDFDSRDWWDPETGAENRLAYHLSDATSEGVGYPNGLGVLVGLAELYWSRVREQQSPDGGDRAAEQDAPDEDAVDAETAERYV